MYHSLLNHWPHSVLRLESSPEEMSQWQGQVLFVRQEVTTKIRHHVPPLSSSPSTSGGSVLGVSGWEGEQELRLP